MPTTDFKLTREWISSWVKILWEKCPFISGNQPFLLNPNHFYGIPNNKDKVIFLMKRYGLPFKNLKIYMHSGLEVPGKVVLSRSYKTEGLKLKHGQKVIHNSDGTYSIADLSDLQNPKITNHTERLPIQNIKLTMFLNADYSYSRELMSAIIAHEVSHLYLHHNGIQQFKSSSTTNLAGEYLTDINASVIGLGRIMLNGCKTKKEVIHRNNRTVTMDTRVGYLPYRRYNRKLWIEGLTV